MILLVTANIQLFMFRSKFWSIFFFVPLQAKKVTMMNHDNMEERFPVVDATGKVLGCATRGECHSGSHLLHPVVHLHVFNSKGEVYLQKDRSGRIYNQGSGILPWAVMSTMGRLQRRHWCVRSAKNWASPISYRNGWECMSSTRSGRVSWCMSTAPCMTVPSILLLTSWQEDGSGRWMRSVKPWASKSSPLILRASSNVFS